MTPERAWIKLETHGDACDDCYWFTLQFCLVGQELQKQYALACASYRKPIASIHRAPGKA